MYTAERHTDECLRPRELVESGAVAQAMTPLCGLTAVSAITAHAAQTHETTPDQLGGRSAQRLGT